MTPRIIHTDPAARRVIDSATVDAVRYVRGDVYDGLVAALRKIAGWGEESPPFDGQTEIQHDAEIASRALTAAGESDGEPDELDGAIGGSGIR